jgi:HK97 family phage major capsid protein/HK97 family phage prohead protease
MAAPSSAPAAPAPAPERTRTVPSVQYRTAELERASIDKEARTIRVSLSSEAPVRQWGIEEILDHKAASIRLKRLRENGVFLWNHDLDQVLGRIQGVEVKDGKLQCEVRWATNSFAEEKWRDVQEGILRETSIGYRVYDAVLEQHTDEVDTYRVMDWEPFEGSLVSIPADSSVGVGRSAASTQDAPPLVLPSASSRAASSTASQSFPMPDTITPPAAAPAAAINVDEVRNQAQQAERTRVSEITTIAGRLAAKVPGLAERAAQFIRDGKSVEEFQRTILVDDFGAKPINSEAPALKDMEKSAKRQYSVRKLINSFNPDRKDAEDIGFEREVSQAIRAAGYRKFQGDFTIPAECLGIGLMGKRTMQATSATSGGYTIATDLMGEMIEKLDEQMYLSRLGVRRLAGLVGNVNIARQTGGATAYWVAENAAITDSELTFDMLALTPHTVGATTPFSKQLLGQSSFDIEAEVRRELQMRLALAIELAFLQGTGAAGQPRGLFNQTLATTAGTPEAGKVCKHTYSSAADFADIVTQIAQFAKAKVPLQNIAWLIDPDTWAKWQTKSKDTGSGQFLCTGTLEAAVVNGYPAIVTNNVPSSKTAVGSWSQAYYGSWAGLDITVDPYALKKQQAIEVTVFNMVDFAFRHLEAWVVSTDSGAQ